MDLNEARGSFILVRNSFRIVSILRNKEQFINGQWGKFGEGEYLLVFQGLDSRVLGSRVLETYSLTNYLRNMHR